MDSNPVVSILLPCCIQLNTDVFFELFKNVVWRSKMDECSLDALKSGMTEKTLCVKSNDLLVDWKELTSKSQRLRQYQLIGYWATQNYPILGKKLFGKTWKPVQRQNIEVIGNNEAMSPDAVDVVLMRKMKLRIIELNTCQRTVSSLMRHFVKTPTNIATFNEDKISKKMKSFDINEDDIEKCWMALKNCNFPMSELENHLEQPDGGIRSENMTGTINYQSDYHFGPAAKRLCLFAPDSIRPNETMSRNGYNLVPLVKRMHLDVTTNIEADDRCSSSGCEMISASELTAEQIYVDPQTTKDSTNDSYRTLWLEMRKEIDKLTERLNSTTDKNLRDENETLKSHIKADASLINALQQSVDSSNKLVQMLESSFQNQVENSAKHLAEADKMNSELSRKNVTLRNELDEMKHLLSDSQKCSHQQIQDLNKRLVDSESVNDKITERNARSDQEISDLKQKLASVETPLQQKIQVLSNNLCDAENVTIEISAKNSKLEQELGEIKQNAENIQLLYEKQVFDLDKNKKENVEMSERIEKLEAEINGLKISVASKHDELIEAMKAEKKLDGLKSYATSMVTNLQDQIKIFEVNLEVTENKNCTLERDITEIRNHAASVEATLQKKIQDLSNNLSEAEKAAVEMSEKNATLEQELGEVKQHNDNIRSQQNQIKVLEDNMADTNKKNLELELELKKWKSEPAPPAIRADDGNECASVDISKRVVDSNKIIPTEKELNVAPVFFSNDPNVRKYREQLAKLPFGWVKFHNTKPAFVHPANSNGSREAQWVIPKNLFPTIAKKKPKLTL